MSGFLFTTIWALVIAFALTSEETQEVKKARANMQHWEVTSHKRE